MYIAPVRHVFIPQAAALDVSKKYTSHGPVGVGGDVISMVYWYRYMVYTKEEVTMDICAWRDAKQRKDIMLSCRINWLKKKRKLRFEEHKYSGIRVFSSLFHSHDVRTVHFELAPSHSSAMSLVLAPVTFSRCDHSDHSLADTGRDSWHDLAVGRPNPYGLEVGNRYLSDGPALALPLALLEVLMTIAIVDGGQDMRNPKTTMSSYVGLGEMRSGSGTIGEG